MGNYNIEFIKNDYLESISDNIYYDSSKKDLKSWLNDNLKEVHEALKQGYTIKICSLDILGNKKEGYDFNDVFRKTEINSIIEFINFWNIETIKLFKKRLIKSLLENIKEEV